MHHRLPARHLGKLAEGGQITAQAKHQKDKHAEEARMCHQLNRAKGSRGDPPCGVQRQSLWWGLGQRPNCSSSEQFKRNSQQRRRQRSVPASNFARPQTRPQAAFPTTCALPRHMGATDPIFHAAPNNLRGVLAFAAGVVYNHSRAMNGSDARNVPESECAAVEGAWGAGASSRPGAAANPRRFVSESGRKREDKGEHPPLP